MVSTRIVNSPEDSGSMVAPFFLLVAQDVSRPLEAIIQFFKDASICKLIVIIMMRSYEVMMMRSSNSVTQRKVGAVGLFFHGLRVYIKRYQSPDDFYEDFKCHDTGERPSAAIQTSQKVASWKSMCAPSCYWVGKKS